jgi:hypothetical protein
MRPVVPLGLFLGLIASSALADTRGAMLTVSAIVVPSTKVEVVSSASTLDVTADDVKRGYVEVRDAARLRITSTSREGYHVDVHSRVPMFRSVEVTIDGMRASIGRDGGALSAPGRHGRNQLARVDYRFELADGVVPGRYPWPVALQARPF